jgi:hypothetical protein
MPPILHFFDKGTLESAMPCKGAPTMKKRRTVAAPTEDEKSVQEAKELICDLCRNLYNQGHVSGTGGGISVRTSDGERIVMAPSGVQKERMVPEDMFVLDVQGNVVHTPDARPPPYKPPKLSECSPLFMAVSRRGTLSAGTVMFLPPGPH